MTSLVAWVGIDARGPASIYIASDSRVTGFDSSSRWDCAKKTFCCLRYPVIFGFCGDAFMPTQILSSIVELIDRDLLSLDGDAFKKTITIKSTIENMQSELHDPNMHSYSIIIGFREGEGFGKCRFDAAQISFDTHGSRFSFECIDLYSRDTSFLIFAKGTGSTAIFKNYELWEKSAEGRTSRSVYGAFCDALKSREDDLSGGAPQIIGLYRIGSGKLFGSVYNHRLYIGGKPITSGDFVNLIEWRDELFQRIDPLSGELAGGAQRHRHFNSHPNE